MAKKNPKYTRNTTTKLTASGILNTEKCTLEIDGDIMGLSTLLSDFNDCEVEISMEVVEEEELDTPEDIG